MKKTLAYIRPYGGKTALALVTKFLGSVAELVLPYVLSHIIDDLIPLKDAAAIYAMGGVMLFFALVALGGNIWANRLSAQVSAGFIIGSLGKYVAVVLGGNLIQFFVVLPLFLLARRINPIRVFRCMLPAVLMALFTKSSAATLPVTVASAENNLKAKEEVARFVLPICCTINMNGCAAFILVTSLFVMQNGGWTLTLPTVALWFFISIISAIGNAGVPMGCYFLTLSLMSGIHAPIGILGIILPIYTIIDMIETAENVWSDSCVCAMVNKTMTAADPTPDAR